MKIKSMLVESMRTEARECAKEDPRVQTIHLAGAGSVPATTFCGAPVSADDYSQRRTVLTHDHPRACAMCLEQRPALRSRFDYVYAVPL
jgi:hypothetical protein